MARERAVTKIGLTPSGEKVSEILKFASYFLLYPAPRIH